MTLEELSEKVAALNIPYTYGYFENEQHPAYIAYHEILRNVIFADGVAVHWDPWIMLTFVSTHRDLTSEQKIHEMLRENKLPFDTPEYEFDEEQGVHITTFNFSIGG